MPESPEVLTVEEFVRAFRALSVADLSRLAMAAKWYVRWTTLEWEDLLHETFTRALAGSRRCPRGVSIIRFLDQTMHSIRGDWVEQWNREHGAIVGVEKSSGDKGASVDQLSPDFNPEDSLIFSDLLSEVSSLFAGDVEAQRIYFGMLDGLRGAELQRHSGIADKTHYESKRKFVRRHLDKYFTT